MVGKENVCTLGLRVYVYIYIYRDGESMGVCGVPGHSFVPYAGESICETVLFTDSNMFSGTQKSFEQPFSFLLLLQLEHNFSP